MAEYEGEMEMMIAHYLNLIAPLVLIIFGTTGNLLSILVMSRRSMRSSNAAVYLIALAIVDTGALNIGLIPTFIQEITGKNLEASAPICKIKFWLICVSLNISVWILVAFTIERFLCVFFPHKVKTFCRRGSSIIVVMCVVVTTFAYSSHFFYGVEYRIQDGGNESIQVTCTLISDDYFYFFYNVYPWLDFCLNCFIPLIIFIVCNSCIAVRVLLRSRNMQKMSDNKTTKHATRQSLAVRDRTDDRSRLTFMLFTVTVVFLITTAPMRVLFILLKWLVEQIQTYKEYALIYLIICVCEILMFVNNSVNFILYCVTGSKFRKELRKMLTRLRDSIFKKHPACDGEKGGSRRPSLYARQIVFTEVTELPNEAIELIQFHDHQDKS